ncbi:MAG: DUF91 domain-containing protein [Halobacteriaceae archaeon]
MQDAVRVLAGECTVTFEDDETRSLRGEVCVVVKPDDTVLVHDADGYRPAAWLTRADTVRVAADPEGFRLVAGADGRRLTVESVTNYGQARYPVSPAGPPVGDCADCDGSLVRDGDRVVCVGCRARYRLPRDATVTDGDCPDCGLPQIAVARGDRFEVCLDHACDPLLAAVADRYDDLPCPTCGASLEFGRDRGIQATCPDCATSRSVPTGRDESWPDDGADPESAYDGSGPDPDEGDTATSGGDP